GVRLRKRGEVADVDEHHRHVTALAGEDIVTLFQQPGSQDRVDVGAERTLKSSPPTQPRLHRIERRRQRAEIVVLDHRQTPAVITGRNTSGALGEVAYRAERRREREARCYRNSEAECQCTPEGGEQNGVLMGSI